MRAGARTPRPSSVAFADALAGSRIRDGLSFKPACSSLVAAYSTGLPNVFLNCLDCETYPGVTAVYHTELEKLHFRKWIIE